MRYALIILLLIPSVSASMTASLSNEGFFSDASCTTPVSSLTASDTFYAKVSITNTGTEDIPNGLIRLNSYDQNPNAYGNWGHLWTLLQNEIDVRTGETVELCIDGPVYSSLRPGDWRFYFFYQTSYSTTLGGTNAYTTVVNDGSYAHLQVTGIPWLIEQDIDEETMVTISITNHAPYEFSGRTTLSCRLYYTDTGNCGSYAITIPADASVERRYNTTSRSYPSEYRYGFNVFHNSGQRLRGGGGKRVSIGGGAPAMYQQRLYTNQSVYFDGDTARITVRLRNIGANVNDPADYFVLTVKNLDSGSTIHTESIEFERVLDPYGSTEEFVSSEFVVSSGGEPLSDFSVTMRPYFKSGDRMNCYHCASARYTVKSFDPVPSCGSEQQGSENLYDTYEVPYCATDSVTFIELTRTTPYRIDVVSGTMYGWNEGLNKDGLFGVFVYGEPGLEVNLVYLLPKVIELDSFPRYAVVLGFAAAFMAVYVVSRR